MGVAEMTRTTGYFGYKFSDQTAHAGAFIPQKGICNINTFSKNQILTSVIKYEFTFHAAEVRGDGSVLNL